MRHDVVNESRHLGRIKVLAQHVEIVDTSNVCRILWFAGTGEVGCRAAC